MRLFRTNTHYNDDGTTTVTMFDVSWDDLRSSRDACLKELVLYYLPDRWDQLSSEHKGKLNTYRQTLRNLPELFETANEAVDNWPEPEDWF